MVLPPKFFLGRQYPIRFCKKKSKDVTILASFGGELGIRTLGPFRDTAFRVLHHRPLGQLSIYEINRFPGCLFVAYRNFVEHGRKTCFYEIPKGFWKKERTQERTP